MSAVEFVKKHGWDQSWTCLNLCASPNDKWFIYNGDSISDSDFDELVKLVDSYELVESYGGISMAKRQYSCFANASKSVGVNQSARVVALGKAIADVEKCQ